MTAIAYSCVAPLVLGFATIGLGLIYLVSRYNSIYTLTTTIDTKGQAYARAMQQLTVGVYLAEVCLIGLFAIKIGEGVASIGPLLLMVILLITTALFHAVMRKALHPLMRTLPSSLLTKMEESRYSSAMLEEGVIGYSYEGEIRYHSSSDANSVRQVSDQGDSIRPVSEHGDLIRPAENRWNPEVDFSIQDTIEQDSAPTHELNETEETEKVHSIVNGIIARSNAERLALTESQTAEKKSTSENTMCTAEEGRSLEITEQERRDLNIREMPINASAKVSAEEDAWLRLTATRNNRDTFRSVWSPSPTPSAAPPPTGSFIMRFFLPSKYASYAHLKRKLEGSIFVQPVPMYAPEVARTAYFHPCIAKETPVVWIVRDQMGISEQEKRHSRKILRVEDDGAWFDEKGKICWDSRILRNCVVWDRTRDILI